MWPFKQWYEVKWLGTMGCGYPTDDKWFCEATSKRDAHKQFIAFLGEAVRRQYTCAERLLDFKEIEPDITRVEKKEG